MTAKFKTIPNHIAYIIDGNGRWAKKRGLPRKLGHSAGMNALKNIITDTYDLGIKIISVFGFSTENWNRPKEELDGLFNLFKEFMDNDKFDYMSRGIKVRVMGDYYKFPTELVEAVNKITEDTKNNENFVLNLGINYGGRDEIIYAVNNILKEKAKVIEKCDIDEHLYTNGLPDPDFIIRTSGELRLSNFMLWQMAYSELYFTKTYWPDFNKRCLYKALKNYQKRNRRYGAIKEEKK